MELSSLALVLVGTGFTFLATALGSAMVYFVKDTVSESLERAFLGFAAGVMIAASVWSLLIPAIESAEQQGKTSWLSAAAGFAFGGLFLMLLDRLLPHLHPGSEDAEGLPSSWKRTTMLVLAVTLHNIPEGMAVGLSFAVAARDPSSGALAGAAALAIGMGLQNFPEGAAVSLPMKSQGASAHRAFLYGAASGVVEPVFGLLTVLAAGSVEAMMPWVLSFAAGAMIYVVVEELIPEAQLGEHSHSGTLSVMGGFLAMMLLDVLLG